MKKKIIIGSIILIVIIGIIVSFSLFKEKYLITLNAQELQEKIEAKDDFILVISQEGCSHCKAYIPVLKDVLNEHKITAYIIDTATFNKEEKAFLRTVANISGTPTTAFIKDGEETSTSNRLVGSASKKTIETRFKDMGYLK